ncbi:hypothetical protein DS909_14490 [Phaeobacter gallaeciensis]|uniref:Uncharacterized protein n=1 Tax=Phaeobacter gallaeciensis TaxID=60890 RepID=A0A366WTM7_9RHOB|nr:hypothetical protein DS909_14490 [Phaeobacter gallaeciensis]
MLDPIATVRQINTTVTQQTSAVAFCVAAELTMVDVYNTSGAKVAIFAILPMTVLAQCRL